MENNVQEVLNKHKITQITDFSEIEAIFDVNSLKSKKPTIHKKDSDVLIIFDHPDFNKAFMHDMLDFVLTKIDEQSFHELFQLPGSSFTEEQINLMMDDFKMKLERSVKSTEIFYCNSMEINSKLFEPFFKNMFDHHMMNNAESEDEKPKFEFDSPPVILMINKDVDVIFLDFESFMPFDSGNITSAFLTIDNAVNVIKHQEEVEKQKRDRIIQQREQEAVDQIADNVLKNPPTAKA